MALSRFVLECAKTECRTTFLKAAK